ncbi:MAG: BhlA/UviB family holin-like peptide [Paraclostridium sp.]
MEDLLQMTIKEGIFACLFFWLLVTVFKEIKNVNIQLNGQIAEQWKCIEKQNDIIEKQTDQLDEQNKKIDNLTVAVKDLSDTVRWIVENKK